MFANYNNEPMHPTIRFGSFAALMKKDDEKKLAALYNGAGSIIPLSHYCMDLHDMFDDSLFSTREQSSLFYEVHTTPALPAKVEQRGKRSNSGLFLLRMRGLSSSSTSSSKSDDSSYSKLSTAMDNVKRRTTSVLQPATNAVRRLTVSL